MKKKSTKSENKHDYVNKNSSLHNGKMTLYEDPIERDTTTTTATTSLTYSDNAHSYDFYSSPPLILRSYTSFQSSAKPQQKSNDNPNHLTDLPNRTTTNMKSSIDYIHRLVEQNERRYERQEQNTLIGREWQILSRVVDRLLVFVFLVSTMFVFYSIFRQAPHLRLK
jgi:hypothetical protein